MVQKPLVVAGVLGTLGVVGLILLNSSFDFFNIPLTGIPFIILSVLMVVGAVALTKAFGSSTTDLDKVFGALALIGIPIGVIVLFPDFVPNVFSIINPSTAGARLATINDTNPIIMIGVLLLAYRFSVKGGIK